MMGIDRLSNHLGSTTDAASVRAFRLGFGLLAAAAATRFVAKGWVHTLYVEPALHFTWFDWVTVPGPAVLYALFATQILGGLGTALCTRFRPWLALWLTSFITVELFDKALYLNHYVLMTLLGMALLAAPACSHQPLSRAWLTGVRLLVASVYLWAGACKVNSDWLLRAQPLTTWLQARADIPGVGPLLAWNPTAFAMSWAGCVFDLVIGALLLYRPTRAAAVVVALVFHTVLGGLFHIGIFPWLMALCITLFFDPSWPRRVAALSDRVPVKGSVPWSMPRTLMWTAIMTVVLVTPARGYWLSRDVNWTERGYRFAWRVLLTEKTGMLEYRVVCGTERPVVIVPRHHLSDIQWGQIVGKPDLIAQYGRHLGTRHPGCAVHAESWVSLNGHRAQQLIDPTVDLTMPASDLPSTWIRPRLRSYQSSGTF